MARRLMGATRPRLASGMLNRRLLTMRRKKRMWTDPHPLKQKQIRNNPSQRRLSSDLHNMGICKIADTIKHCTIEPSTNPLPAQFFRTLHRSHIRKGISNIYTFVFPFDDLIISFYVSSRNRFKGNYTVILITYWGKIEAVITDSLIIIPTESSKAAALALRTAAI